MMDNIDPHTGYPMKFERMTDRWSPVYVKKDSALKDYLIVVFFAIVMALMLFFAI